MIGSMQQRLNLVSDRQKATRLESVTNPALRLEPEISPNSPPIHEAEQQQTSPNYPSTMEPLDAESVDTRLTSTRQIQQRNQQQAKPNLENQPRGRKPRSSQPRQATGQEVNTNGTRSHQESQPTGAQPSNAVDPVGPPTVPAEPQQSHQVENQPAGRIVRQRQSRETFNCDECSHKARSLLKLDGHINASHVRPNHFQSLSPATLLVGDSHLKSLKRRWCVEKGLGGKGKLYIPGLTNPSEDRAYCSTRDWPGAWHPENSLEEVLPRLLSERPYSSAIILTSCNDITNIRGFSSLEEQRLMASQSSRNTIRVIEDALRSYPTLRKIVCIERPVRVDDMAELSSYSNSELRRLAVASEFARMILVSSNSLELCTTEEEKVAVFRAPNSKGADGIHMKGEKGQDIFTNILIAAAKLASLSSRGLEGRRRFASRMDGEQESSWAREPQSASGLNEQEQRVQPATWAEVASMNLQSNQSN